MVTNSIPNRQRLIELWKVVFIRVGALPFILVGILVIFGVWNPAFLSSGNMFMVSRSATYLIVVTLGQMLALLSGGLDLSVGGSITLISVVSAMVMVALKAYPGVDVFVGVLTGIGVGALVGATNGYLIAYRRIAPFIATFAMGSIANGVCLIITGGGLPIFGVPGSFVGTLGRGEVLGVSVPIIVTILLVGVMYFILSWTRFGRYIYALGGSREAAHVMGIPIRRYTFLTYVIVGILVGLAGVMLLARTGAGEVTLGLEMPLLSIAAAVLGGVSLFGGEGKLYGAVLGAVAIILLRVGMDMARIGSFVQMAAVGVVLIMVVVIDRYRRQMV
jgi:ribose transport system permease protein